MKQRITVEDLKSLTPSQQEKLRAWWKPQIGDWFIHVNGEIEVVGYITMYNTVQCLGDIKRGTFASWDKERLTPLISIGQCIELLGCKLIKIDYDYFTNNYYVQVLDIGTNAKPELIDALWEAVKAIL